MDDEKRTRGKLGRLAAALRKAVQESYSVAGPSAQALDSCRCDIERLMMLDAPDPGAVRRAIWRAEVALDSWRARRISTG